MVAGSEFEDEEAEAGTEGAAGVEEPEGRGGPFLEEAESRHRLCGGLKSECEFEVGGDHAGCVAAAAR